MTAWRHLPLGDLGVEVRDNVTPEAGTTYAHYSVPSFESGEPVLEDGGAIKSSKRALRPGDVLISRINPRINRVWRVGEHATSIIGSTEWVTLRLSPTSPVDGRYLMWYLRSPRFRADITSAVSGVTGSHTRAKPKEILAYGVPVPSRAEQQAIVENLERMLSHLDAARMTASTAQRRLEPMRRSVLADVFRLRQSTSPELPDGWQAASIGEVAEVRLGRQRSPKDHLGDQMRPYLRAANVTWYRLRGDDVQEMNFTDEEMSVYALREGDLLAVEGGTPEDVGKCALVTEPFVGYAFQNTLIRLRARPGVDHRWLMYRLNAEGELGGYRSIARGAGNIQHVSVTRYRAHPLALPPIEEQQLQVERLEAELSRMRHLSTTLTTASHRSAALQRSILKAAFEGRLARAAQHGQPLDDLQEAIA